MSFKQYPIIEIKINEIIQYLRSLTVIKYNREVKNISNRELSFVISSIFELELLLKVINNVSSVNIKPALVRDIFDKSDITDINWSLVGIPNPK